MSIFKEQISEDIEHIQQDYQENNPYLQKEEYAFNYWVLTKLFNIDSEIVDENVTEYNDDGIDCFVFYEDSKELYIIQNKFYSENTQLKRNYVIDDFLVRPLNSLKNNNYKRSEKLQQIFNKIKNDSDYRIYLHMYVTNDFKDQTIIDTFYKYQNNDNNILCYVEAKIFYLSDIVEMYFEDRKLDVKNFKCEFYTINDATFLNINKENYNLPIHTKGINLVSNKENLDSSTPTGKLMLTMIGAINEFERTNLLERQREGIAIAKAEGKFKGRQVKQIDNFPAYYERYKNREFNKIQLAKELNVTRPTLDRLIKEFENK